MNDEEARRKAILDAYTAKVEAGEPVVEWAIDEILKVGVLTTGELAFDFPMAGTLGDQTAVARLVLSPRSAQALKAWLVANENIPDTPPAKLGPKSTN